MTKRTGLEIAGRAAAQGAKINSFGRNATEIRTAKGSVIVSNSPLRASHEGFAIRFLRTIGILIILGLGSLLGFSAAFGGLSTLLFK